MQTKQNALGIIAALALLSGGVAGALAYSGSKSPAAVGPVTVSAVAQTTPLIAAAENENENGVEEKDAENGVEEKDTENGVEEKKDAKEHAEGVEDKDDEKDSHLTAAITPAQAQAFALAVQPGTVTESELEDEDGVTVYGVDITAADGRKYDVKVDATSGKVLKSEADNEDDD